MAADGSVVIDVNMNTDKAEKDLAKLKNKIEKSEENLEETRQKREEAAQKSVFDAAELDKEKAKLEKMKQDLQEMKAIAKDKGFSLGAREEAKSQLPQAQADIAEQSKRVSMLQTQWNKTQGSVDRYDAKIKEATKEIDKQKAKAGQLEKKLDEARKPAARMADAFSGSDGSLKRLRKRIASLAGSALVFSAITAALVSFRKYLSKVLKTNENATAAFSRLKGALLTLAQPLVEVIIPALTVMANLLTVIVTDIARALSALSGKTVSQSAAAAESLYQEAEALEGVGDAADEAAGSLAGFDEINTIQTETPKQTGAVGDIVPDFSLDAGFPDRLKEIADLVMLIALGLAAWKVGTSLPGVLGTIATKLGGILLAVGGLLLMWHGLTDAWENGIDWLNLIEMVGGLAAAAAGLYIAFGPIAAGIALVVGGLAMLVTGFRDAMENGWNLENTLTSISGILAAGLGISMITGSWIPALIAGIAAVLLAITNATGHGEELLSGIRTMMEGFIDFFTGIFTGDLEKALGGVEKIVDGLGAVVGSILDGVRDTILSFLDWLDEKTGGRFHGLIETVKEMVTGLFSNLKTALSGWVDGFKKALSGLIQFITGVFTGDWDTAWEGVKNIFKGVLDICITTIESAVNLIIQGLNWLVSQINKIQFSVPDWVPGIGGKTLSPNIPAISEVKLPRLAMGAVIPPNREFMAVLGDQKTGTNIEAPLSEIEKAVENVLDRQGGGNQRPVQVNLVVDGKTLARVIVPNINDMTRQAGKPVLLV